ncbi:MAG: lytic transglycosylase domain-containing protein, partial [Methylobacter sp.]
MRRTTKAVASSLFCLSFVIFGKSCLALETHHAAKNSSVTTPPQNAIIAPSKLQKTLWWQIANRHQLDPYILYAVALIESAKDSTPNHVTPWPWA